MYGVNSSANSYILANLRQINSDLSTAQTRIGTGLKVSKASDNASVWAIAQSLRSEQKGADSLSTSIGVAKGRADAAVAALDASATVLNQMKSLALNLAATNPSDRTAMTSQLTSLQSQLTSALAGAKFQGQNWLTDTIASAGTSGVVTIGITGSTLQTLDAGLSKQNDTGTGLTLLAAVTGLMANGGTSTATSMTGADLAAAVDAAATQLTAYQTKLATFSSGLGTQQDLLKALSATRSSAISDLVDADMSEESAKVTALQTQQQLAYQAISIGNSSASNILALFR